MIHNLIISNEWDYHIIYLIKKGLNNKKIAEQVPFTTSHVERVRENLKSFSGVKMKGGDPLSR